jgi:hypothetical protein
MFCIHIGGCLAGSQRLGLVRHPMVPRVVDPGDIGGDAPDLIAGEPSEPLCAARARPRNTHRRAPVLWHHGPRAAGSGGAQAWCPKWAFLLPESKSAPGREPRPLRGDRPFRMRVTHAPMRRVSSAVAAGAERMCRGNSPKFGKLDGDPDRAASPEKPLRRQPGLEAVGKSSARRKRARPRRGQP